MGAGWGRKDSLFCGKATAGQTVHRTVCLDRPFESALQIPKHTKRPIRKDWSFCGGGGRIRSPAGEPRRLRVSTGHSLRAAFRILTSTQNKTADTERYQLFCGGGGRIRTIEAKRSRFTVCPLWPLGNSPIFFLFVISVGAGRRTRTPDLLITNQWLYQLSYTGKRTERIYYSTQLRKVKNYFRKLRKFRVTRRSPGTNSAIRSPRPSWR